VLCLLPSITLESLGDLGITLAISLAAHRQIHTNLGALTHKVILQTLDNLFVNTLSNANHVLVNKLKIAFLLYELNELICANLAKGALLGSCITFVNITAYGTFPFLHSCNSF
jgi:hypothetical protein